MLREESSAASSRRGAFIAHSGGLSSSSSSSAAAARPHQAPRHHQDGKQALQELVAAALDSEDVLPLVRVVFESRRDEAAKSSSGSRLEETAKGRHNGAAQSGGLGADEASSQRFSRSASSRRHGAEGAGAQAAEALRSVVTAQEKEIERLCNVHYADIARCSQDIELMANPVFRIRETMFEGNRALQDAGSGLLTRLKEVQELTLVKERLQDAESAVEGCTKALELCEKAWSTVEAGQLHQALTLAQGISRMVSQGEAEDLNTSGDALNASTASASGAAAAAAAGAAVSGHAADGGEDCDLRLLRPFVVAQAAEITSAVEQRVLEDFKSWLLEVRGKAADIGRKAIRMAAQQRQSEDEMLAEARAIQAALLDCRDPRKAASLCRGSSSSSSGAHQRGGAASPGGEGDDNMRSLLDGLSMVPLYSAHLVYRTLDKAAWFRTTYLDNRRQQMTTDLTLTHSQPFVDVYQSYLNQVVGFFLVEDRVLRTSDGITTPSGVDSLWENALAQIKVSLLGAYDRLADPNALLLVKDFVHLVCRALSACSFHVTPIEEVLTNGRNRYHDLLMQDAARECSKLMGSDSLRSPMRVATEAELAAVREAALPWDLSADERGLPLPPTELREPPPKLPFTAPFTAAVPKLLRLVRRSVADSTGYLRGIMGPGEFLPLVRHLRDRLISKVICEQASARLSAGAEVAEALRVAADAWSMSGGALVAIEEYTVSHGRGDVKARATRRNSSGGAGLASLARGGSVPRSIVSGSEASAALDALLKGAVAHAAAAMATRLDSLVASAASALSWMPDTAASSGRCSAYMEKSVMYMQEHLQAAVQVLPRPVACKLQRDTVKHFAKSLVGLLQGPKIPKFNIHAVQRLDLDLLEVEDFATCLSIGGGGNLQEEFATLRGVVKLLLSNEVDKLLEEGLQSETYGPVLLSSSPQLLTVADVLDKYRETSGGLLPSRGGKQAEQPRRRDLDRLVKFLRDAANGLIPAPGSSAASAAATPAAS